jgi:succinoglycan biosynthesis protein ExoA
VLKHRLRPRLRQTIPAVNVAALAACLAIAPVHRAFLLGPAAYLALLVGVSLWIAARHRSACGLWAGPALAAMHLPWGAGFLWQLATGPKRGGADVQLHGLSLGPATLPVPSPELEPTDLPIRAAQAS